MLHLHQVESPPKFILIVEAPEPEYADVPYEEDSADAVVEVGTKCRRNGCNAVYKGKESKTEDCFFHPGAPLFHEAVKGWTCCKSRKTEWEDFLQIEGCLIGKHKFLPFAKEVWNMQMCFFVTL